MKILWFGLGNEQFKHFVISFVVGYFEKSQFCSEIRLIIENMKFLIIVDVFLKDV